MGNFNDFRPTSLLNVFIKLINAMVKAELDSSIEDHRCFQQLFYLWKAKICYLVYHQPYYQCCHKDAC